MLYASIDGELPTRPLFDAARGASRVCALPCVLPDRRLELRIASRWEKLRRRRYGLLEPEEGSEVVALADADLVLVPGLAFDPRGGRLGRGGGYYDRVLGGVPRDELPPVFGLAHDWQVVDEVPCGTRDVRVDGIVTELRVLRAE